MSLAQAGIAEHALTEPVRWLRVRPSPVTNQATIGFELPRAISVSCVVYDATGNVVARLAEGLKAAGQHRVTWKATGANPGVYFCKLVAGGVGSTARFTVVR